MEQEGVIELDERIDVHQLMVALVMDALGRARVLLHASEDPALDRRSRIGSAESARNAAIDPCWYDDEEDVTWACYRSGAGGTSRWSTPLADGGRLLVCCARAGHGRDVERISEGVFDVLAPGEIRLVMRSDDLRRTGQPMRAPSATSTYRLMPDGRVLASGRSLVPGRGRPGPLPSVAVDAGGAATSWHAEGTAVRDRLLVHELPTPERFTACLGSVPGALPVAHELSALALRLGLIA